MSLDVFSSIYLVGRKCITNHKSNIRLSVATSYFESVRPHAFLMGFHEVYTVGFPLFHKACIPRFACFGTGTAGLEVLSIWLGDRLATSAHFHFPSLCGRASGSVSPLC